MAYERRKTKVELLSPAGDMECLNMALTYGADAIYLAGQEFGMRTASANFSNEQLAKAVQKAHEKNVPVFLTCNTLPRNDELDRLPAFLEAAQAAGVDAIIVADLGVMEFGKTICTWKVEISYFYTGRYCELCNGKCFIRYGSKTHCAGQRIIIG